jgi:hypothetical protein
MTPCVKRLLFRCLVSPHPFWIYYAAARLDPFLPPSKCGGASAIYAILHPRPCVSLAGEIKRWTPAAIRWAIQRLIVFACVCLCQRSRLLFLPTRTCQVSPLNPHSQVSCIACGDLPARHKRPLTDKPSAFRSATAPHVQCFSVAALISSPVVNDHYLSSCFSKVTKGDCAASAFESRLPKMCFTSPLIGRRPLKGETGSYRPKCTFLYNQ